VLMSSTHCAYPQVISRHLASFRVVKFHVSAAHDHFWVGFDSRQLPVGACGRGCGQLGREETEDLLLLSAWHTFRLDA
jgi:hypothetical protein